MSSSDVFWSRPDLAFDQRLHLRMLAAEDEQIVDARLQPLPQLCRDERLERRKRPAAYKQAVDRLT